MPPALCKYSRNDINYKRSWSKVLKNCLELFDMIWEISGKQNIQAYTSNLNDLEEFLCFSSFQMQTKHLSWFEPYRFIIYVTFMPFVDF